FMIDSPAAVALSKHITKAVKRFTPRVDENKFTRFQSSWNASLFSIPKTSAAIGPKNSKCLTFIVSIAQPSESTQTKNWFCFVNSFGKTAINIPPKFKRKRALSIDMIPLPKPSSYFVCVLFNLKIKHQRKQRIHHRLVIQHRLRSLLIFRQLRIINHLITLLVHQSDPLAY